jgi:hypothetical protein
VIGSVIGGRLLLTVRGPRIHQPTPLFERVIAPVRLLGLVADRVRKRCLGNLTRELGLIPRPIAKVERKPCVVRSPRPILRSVINSAMSDSGLPALAPEKMCAPLPFMSSRIANARALRGAAMFPAAPHAPLGHRPNIALYFVARRAGSLACAHSRMANSSARAAMLSRSQLVMNAGNSA